jgi:beta-lactamase superfamily II metal-dependent hydrolase
MSNGQGQVTVSLLDVGPREYGDALVLQFDGTSVMVDGGHVGRQNGDAEHPSIPSQLARLLDQSGEPYTVDLLIVSHAHQDHVGCLPYLIKRGILRCRWALMPHPGAAFGRALNEGSPVDSLNSDRVRAVLAGLREEVPHPTTTDFELMQMLDAAASLEVSFTRMLEDLEAAGTQVIVPSDPTGPEMASLLTEFEDIGLAVLGPTADLLDATAEGIRGAIDTAVDAVVELAALDSRASATDLYRRLSGPSFDGIDASSRPGNLVNLQSYTTTFESSGVRLLLAGDMQFTDPQSGNKRINDAVDGLRQQLAAQAPYSFVKLSHHGSDNAFNATILEEMGETSLYGICAGAHSSHHPEPSVLQLLNSRRNDLTWVRSDRNGLTSIEFVNSDIDITTSAGQVNDPTPNEADATVTPVVPEESISLESRPQVEAPLERAETISGDQIEVTTRIPHTATTVRVTIDVDPHLDQDRVDVRRELAPSTAGDSQLASGRQLPKLLFATNVDALAGNIGHDEAGEAVAAIRNAGQLIVEMPPSSSDPTEALATMRSALAANSDVAGVVLLGGYNVVQRFAWIAFPVNFAATSVSRETPTTLSYGATMDSETLTTILFPTSRSVEFRTDETVSYFAPRFPQRRAKRRLLDQGSGTCVGRSLPISSIPYLGAWSSSFLNRTSSVARAPKVPMGVSSTSCCTVIGTTRVGSGVRTQAEWRPSTSGISHPP